jgi:hypothetical protein
VRRIKAVLFAGTAFTAALVAQSASAADQPPPLRREAPPLAAASHWDGLYASVSAGGTWLRGNYSQQRSTTSSDVFNVGPLGSPATFTSIQNSTSADGFTTTGRDRAAVFTFTMGYNVVYSSWLFGIQSEVSRNVGQIFLTGSGLSRSASTTLSGAPFAPALTDVSNSVNTTSNTAILHHDWTVSEMAKIGFLATQQWLVYGLLGASIGGFNVNEATPFTVWGGTWGGGVERDFGFLRAFVQVKQINYRSKDVAVPASSTSTRNSIDPTGGSFTTDTFRTIGGETRRLSTSETVVTAGITVPIDLSGWTGWR